ncbi:MAG: hypothetical protein ACYCUG_16795, partial [Acidimicrobiales bacterium]
MTDPEGADRGAAGPTDEGTDGAGNAARDGHFRGDRHAGAAVPPGIDPEGVTGWFASHVDGARPPLRF